MLAGKAKSDIMEIGNLEVQVPWGLKLIQLLTQMRSKVDIDL